MAIINGTAADELLVGGADSDIINGLAGNDTLRGGGGNDVLFGGEGDDVLDLALSVGTANGGPGDDRFLVGMVGSWQLDGGPGIDTIVFGGLEVRLEFSGNGLRLVQGSQGARGFIQLGSFEITGIEFMGLTPILDLADYFAVRTQSFNGGVAITPTAGQAYQGPVAGLRWQYLGGAFEDWIGGTGRNDFINGLGGADAIDGGAGDDVIDGGLGSNFLRGGAGIDTFFLDGRGSDITWSTITDWQAGEQLSLWGFRPGVSRLLWLESDGTPGYQGATLHTDLDGNGRIDASVTFAGMTRQALPVPRESDGLLWFS